MAQPIQKSPIMQYFASGHLKPTQKRVSQKFADLAEFIDREMPRSEQSRLALTLLLQSKDAAVRASFLDGEPGCEALVLDPGTYPAVKS